MQHLFACLASALPSFTECGTLFGYRRAVSAVRGRPPPRLERRGLVGFGGGYVCRKWRRKVNLKCDASRLNTVVVCLVPTLCARSRRGPTHDIASNVSLEGCVIPVPHCLQLTGDGGVSHNLFGGKFALLSAMLKIARRWP